MICRYAKMCKGYRKASHTCNDDREASGYCGFFTQFAEKEREAKTE